MKTKTIHDGGPAFPCDNIIIRNNVTGNMQGKSISSTGITLRDYFAAKAMAALISLPEASATADSFATEAYRYADDMLKARSA